MGIVAHSYNPSTGETKERELPEFQGQPGQQNETLI